MSRGERRQFSWCGYLASWPQDELMGNLLTVREAASALRVTERTIRARISSGDLLALKLGPERGAPVRIREDSLLQFMRPVERSNSNGGN
jgi:excisionase family DNA binding protein